MPNYNTQMTDTGGYRKPQQTKTSDYWQHVNQQNAANSASNSKATSNTRPATNPAATNMRSLVQDIVNRGIPAMNNAAQNAAANISTSGGGSGNYGGYSRYSSYGSSGSGGTAGTVDNTAALAAALQAQKQARLDAINAANAALDQQAESLRNRYATSLSAIGQDYQNLRNQAEVNRYRAMYNQREALANRGALDSGMGRQEAMTMQNNYGNNLNSINLQEAQERANIQNAINDMYASVEQQKAANMTNGLADYSSALQNLINAQYSGYTPEGSSYYQQALQALGTPVASTATPVASQQVSDNAYLKYLRAMGYNV